ncbi:MAG TPA: ATP-binding domain-containing protein, partial [Acidimicrobiales bacterium]|nr:ATP-binding domain-containing protein [Acidimicrobiales bacterium]
DQLDIGEQALCFGRIDRRVEGAPEAGPAGTESFHIGRLGISGEDLEPLVVDWRAPVAEPFYRATGREPMGLVLRRHLAAQGRRIVGLEDEWFGPPPAGAVRAGVPGGPDADRADLELGGPGALLAALEGARTGVMRDIVATIQSEQDAIIRSPLPGVMVVQGGPGTGKTAVALHRAAYLLYTHRFPLERQGVLVIGPNPLFLRYIEHVLPSLGESGVTLSTVAGLVHGVAVRSEDGPGVARLKGDARMAALLARAVRSRQRGLRRDAEVPYGAAVLRLPAEASGAIVAAARRRPGTHNARRRYVEQLVVRRLADDYLRTLGVHGVAPGGTEEAGFVDFDPLAAAPTPPSPPGTLPFGTWTPPPAGGAEHDGAGNGHAPGVPAGTPPHGNGHGRPGDPTAGGRRGETDDEEPEFDLAEFSRQVRRRPEVAEILDRMWPRLSAEELLHDLFGSRPLVGLAGRGILTAAEQALLARPRSATLAEIPWTAADLALVDEARVLLGPRRGRSGGDHDEAPRTYGHIVVDEAQDLSPMQLRSVARRSLSGSVTVVGDIGQATGPWAPAAWDDVVAHLPGARPARMVELTVSYRTPAEVIEVAGRLLAVTAPGLRPPTPVRRTGVAPRLRAVAPSELARSVAAVVAEAAPEVTPGTVGVLAPASLVGEVALALDAAGVEATDPRRDGLGAPVSLLPVDLANGLEFDAVVVVEPARIAQESPQGLRALYVALTRPTRRLWVVHSAGLPAPLAG